MEDYEKNYDAARLLLEAPQEDNSELLLKLQAYADQESQRNQIKEMANIGSSMAEGMTGASKGHRLGMGDEQRNALATALRTKFGGSLSAKDKLYGNISLGEAGRKQKQAVRSGDQRDKSIVQNEKKIGQAQEKMDRPSDVQTEESRKTAEAQLHLDNILEQKKNFNTGPVAGPANRTARKFGLDDSEFTGFASMVGQNLVDYIRNASGLTVSNEEAERLKYIVPNMDDEDESFVEKLAATKKWIADKAKSQREAVIKQGKAGDRLLQAEDLSEKPKMSDQDQQAYDWARKDHKDEESKEAAKRILKTLMNKGAI